MSHCNAMAHNTFLCLVFPYLNYSTKVIKSNFNYRMHT